MGTIGLAHPYSNRPAIVGFCDEHFGFGTGAPVADAERIALSGMMRGLPRTEDAGHIWGTFGRQCEGDLSILAEGESSAVNEVARHLFGLPLTHGFLQGHEAFKNLSGSVEHRSFTGCVILDRFFRLAEAVGVRRVLSAEHGQTEIAVRDLDEIFAMIEDAIGADLPAPAQDGDMFGLRLRGGLYSDRHFDGIYAAWRAKNIAVRQGIERPRLCEIGGGAGHVAYYSRILGCREYTIIDLPQAQAVQYLLLSTAYGAEKMQVGCQSGPGIRLLPAGSAAAEDFSSYDLILNIDSIPEMPPSSAERYMASIRHDQIFLSINQESGVNNGEHLQNVTCELASRLQFRRLSRYPSWMRTGWVEEVYNRRG